MILWVWCIADRIEDEVPLAPMGGVNGAISNRVILFLILIVPLNATIGAIDFQWQWQMAKMVSPRSGANNSIDSTIDGATDDN